MIISVHTLLSQAKSLEVDIKESKLGGAMVSLDAYTSITTISATDQQLAQIADAIQQYLATRDPEYPDQQRTLNEEHKNEAEAMYP